MMRINPRTLLPLMLVLFASFIISIPWLGLKDFYSRGEPREALVAQSIFHSGNWILAQGYGGAIPSKPPLAHWLMNVVAKITGNLNEFSARMPSALSSLIFVLCFYTFLKNRRNVQQAFLASLILLTTIEWSRATSTCRVDMLLSTCILACLLLLFKWWEQNLKGYPTTAILFLAAATLAKGPIALVLTASIFSIFLYLRSERLQSILFCAFKFIFPAGLLAASWYVLAYKIGGQAFWDKFYYENVARFASSMDDEPHKHSAFYLYSTVILGLMPWCLVLCIPIWKSAKTFFLKLKLRSINFRTLPSLEQYFIITILAFLVFFSIPSSKRSVYLLPIYPFLSYFLARLIISAQAWQTASPAIILKCLAALVVFVFTIVGLVYFSEFEIEKSSNLAFHINQLRNFPLARGTNIPLWILIGFSVTILFFKVSLKWEYKAIGLFVLLLTALNCSLLPFFANSISSKRFAQEVQTQIPESARLYSFGREYYATSFYLERRIERIEEILPAGGFVIVNEGDRAKLESLAPADKPLRVVHKSSYGVEKPTVRLLLMEINH